MVRPQEVDMFGHNIDVYLCTLHQLQNRLAKKVHRLSLIQTIRNDPLFDNVSLCCLLYIFFYIFYLVEFKFFYYGDHRKSSSQNLRR